MANRSENPRQILSGDIPREIQRELAGQSKELDDGCVGALFAKARQQVQREDVSDVGFIVEDRLRTLPRVLEDPDELGAKAWSFEPVRSSGVTTEPRVGAFGRRVHPGNHHDLVHSLVDRIGAPGQVTNMGSAKKKAVVNAEAEQLSRVERLVREGRYRSVSEFVREAIADKLQALNQSRVEEQLERYCAAGLAREDDDLIAGQAIEDTAPAPRPGRKSRATR